MHRNHHFPHASPTKLPLLPPCISPCCAVPSKSCTTLAGRKRGRWWLRQHRQHFLSRGMSNLNPLEGGKIHRRNSKRPPQNKLGQGWSLPSPRWLQQGAGYLHAPRGEQTPGPEPAPLVGSSLQASGLRCRDGPRRKPVLAAT